MEIKRLDVGYLDFLTKLEEEIFKESAYKKDYLCEALCDSRYIVAGVLEDEKLLGYIIVLDIVDSYEILKIGVDKENRGTGRGRGLINYLKEKKRDIFLEVRRSNKVGISFYEKNEFKEISIRKNYYNNPKEDGIVYVYKQK